MSSGVVIFIFLYDDCVNFTLTDVYFSTTIASSVILPLAESLIIFSYASIISSYSKLCGVCICHNVFLSGVLTAYPFSSDIFIVSLKTQIATQSEIEWKLNFNNLIMED